MGRSDILLRDKRNRRAIIIEAKKSKRESDMDKDCDAAIDQIVAGKYAEGLYGYTQIFCYGVSFYQKQAKVKKMGVKKKYCPMIEIRQPLKGWDLMLQTM